MKPEEFLLNYPYSICQVTLFVGSKPGDYYSNVRPCPAKLTGKSYTYPDNTRVKVADMMRVFNAGAAEMSRHTFCEEHEVEAAIDLMIEDMRKSAITMEAHYKAVQSALKGLPRVARHRHGYEV